MLIGWLMVSLLAAVAASGCGFDGGNDLVDVVSSSAPHGAKQVAKCGGSSGVIEPPSWKCNYLVRGGAGHTISIVASDLAADGYEIRCDASGFLIELAAKRGNVGIRASTLTNGTFHADRDVVNVSPGDEASPASSGRRIPHGFTFLTVDAMRLTAIESAGWLQRSRLRHTCTRSWLAALGGEAGNGALENVKCQLGWNGASNARGRGAVLRRRPFIKAEIGRDIRDGGCYFYFTADGDALLASGRWSGDRLVLARPLFELVYGDGDPRRWLKFNARIMPDGRLALTSGVR